MRRGKGQGKMPTRKDGKNGTSRGILFLRLCALAAALVCGASLAAYGISALRAGRTGAELEKVYRGAPETSALPAVTPVFAEGMREGTRTRDYVPVTFPPEGMEEIKEGMGTVPPATQVPRVTARPAGERLAPGNYPGNPHLAVSPRFKALREKNKDIVGWLTIGGLIDTAVVQRDNTYYLTHDALGKRNINGAVFLEETVDLKTAPRTLILYGHNMKSGEMFACLRKYEDAAFYRGSPFIRMDTMYEDGLYVVAAAAVISAKEGAGAWVDLSRLCSSTTAWRREEIEKLMALSFYTRTVDAEPGDSLLLLITCVGDGDERRVVLARRLRDGETEADMSERAALAERKN